MTSQLPLPGFPVSDPRPRTRHRYATPSGQYAEAICRACPVRRRFGPFGAKQGFVFQWSRDGEEWKDTEIPCVMKVKRGGKR
jgi:hypothetical protein